MNRRALLDVAPPGTLVPVEWVRELLAQDRIDAEEPLVDLTCEDVGRALGRHPSTVRGWLHADELEGYKLGRQWRVTREALRKFQDRQRQNTIETAKGFRPGREVDLSSWRRVKAKA